MNIEAVKKLLINILCEEGKDADITSDYLVRLVKNRVDNTASNYIIRLAIAELVRSGGIVRSVCKDKPRHCYRARLCG